MSHYRSKDIADIDDFNPGQEYYVVGAHWGATKVEKVEHGEWFGDGKGYAPLIMNVGLSGSDKVHLISSPQWTIHRVDDGYNIKSVEHGSYLGFHHTEIIGSSDPSAGLTASKEPFAWTVEPQNKGDGVFRFTIPNTDVHIDFSSVANPTSSSNQTTEADFAASDSDEAAFAREMAAAGHNFDSGAGRGVGDLDFEVGDSDFEVGDSDFEVGDSDFEVGGNVKGQDPGYSADVEPGQSAGPQLHAFGRSRFPPGYFGK
ncbi:hypothetical protein GGF50DRAFT_54987 [Schizophyllum commune]